jgi:3-phenylpropionate/cinnamic acid dioxygenase small subunit
MPVDRAAVERFLFLEARLMDAHKYDEWLALWELDDATYWVPAGDDDIDPAREVSVIYDRRGQLRNRIRRLRETRWLKEQAPRLKRLISNIELVESGPDEVTVTSNFILAELLRHNQFIWAGTTTHRLAAHEGSFKIRYKKVVLLNNNEPLPNMLFLI